MGKKRVDNVDEVIQDIEELLDNVEVETEEKVDNTEEVVPSYLSPEWSDYVISQLHETEFRDSYPSIVGLRRVAEQLLGPIKNSYARELKQVGEEVVCVYDIEIEWCLNKEGYKIFIVPEYQSTHIYSGVAGASDENNSDQRFRKFHAAISETRAEARALRKALRLNTVTAEELDTKDLVDEPITFVQKACVKNRCEQLKVNLEEFLKENGFDQLEKVGKNEAAILIMKLNKLQSNSPVDKKVV